MKCIVICILIMCTVVFPCTELLEAHEIPTCRACGEKITNSYFETHGSFYHTACFVCEKCKLPIKDSYIVYRGHNYHTSCFENHIALRCAVCAGIIKGRYLLDYWGNACHTWHEEEVIRCDFCQRFLVGSLLKGTVRYSDGRRLCSKCSASAVTDLKEARRLMFEVAERLSKFGLEVNHGAVELQMVGRDKLKELASGRSGDTMGFVDYVVRKNLFGHVSHQRIKMYLLYGMPRVQMISTLAHELTHIWQFLQGRLKQNKALSEGSCNFSSYLVLRSIGGPEAEFIIDSMLKDEDPVYGDGFRKVKRYVEEEGLASWLRQLKRKKTTISSFQ